MSILIIEHDPLDSAQRLDAVLRRHGHRLTTIKLHEGESLPSDLNDVDGVISLGGPQNVDQQSEFTWITRELEIIKEAHDAGLPVLGICLGAQLIATALGGEVGKSETPEIGMGKVTMSFFGHGDPILTGIPWNHHQMHAHGYEVTKPPPGGTPVPMVSSDRCKCQAFRVGLTTYGFQFHFEWDKQRCLEVAQRNEPWAQAMGATMDDIKQGIETHGDAYERIGERLCQQVCARLFPINHRLPDTGENIANFRLV